MPILRETGRSPQRMNRDPVDPVAAFDHVGIYPHRQLSLHGTSEFSALCSAPVTLSRRRHVGEVDLALRLGGQRRQFLANGFRDLAHKLSSQAWLHVAPR